MSKPANSMPASPAADLPETEMKIYTPRSFASVYRERAVSDNAPMRIYERPPKPNSSAAPLG